MSNTDYHISLSDTTTVKGIAIIAMLLHHLFYSHTEYGTMVQQIGLVGKVCVAMFVFLSGYGLTIQCGKMLSDKTQDKKRQMLKLMYKRYVKFYLGYWVVFLIFVPIGVFLFGRSLETAYGTDCNLFIRLIGDILGINDLLSYNITWWFNRLILTLYLIFPLLYMCTRKAWISILILILTYRFGNEYYFTFIFGITIASNIETINNFLCKIDNRILCVLSLLAVIGSCFQRQLCTMSYLFGSQIDGFITLAIILFIISIRNQFGFEYKILPFLGKHSMNIYMVHTFIYDYFFPDFIYGFKYPIFIFSALLLSSLAVSIIIEEVKKRIKLYKIQNYLLELVK